MDHNSFLNKDKPRLYDYINIDYCIFIETKY